jgi:hypothetical protein
MRLWENDHIAVRLIQMALSALGQKMPLSTRANGTLDGIFGPETQGVVKRFQRQNGLVEDGVIGKNTMASLDSRCTFLPDAPTDPDQSHLVAPTTYYIPRPISTIRQPDDAACWATTATIMYKYRNPASFDVYMEQWPVREQIEWVLGKAGEKLVGRPKDFFIKEFNRQQGLRTNDSELLFGQCLGLTKVASPMVRFFDPHSMFVGAHAWAALIRWASGPLAANILNAVAGMQHLYNHWILITGVDLANTMMHDRFAPPPPSVWAHLPFLRIGIIHYFDPWYGSMAMMSSRDLDYLVGPLPEWANSADQYRARIFY